VGKVLGTAVIVGGVMLKSGGLTMLSPWDGHDEIRLVRDGGEHVVTGIEVLHVRRSR
jgi:hypothetical protein